MLVICGDLYALNTLLAIFDSKWNLNSQTTLELICPQHRRNRKLHKVPTSHSGHPSSKRQWARERSDGNRGDVVGDWFDSVGTQVKVVLFMSCTILF